MATRSFKIETPDERLLAGLLIKLDGRSKDSRSAMRRFTENLDIRALHRPEQGEERRAWAMINDCTSPTAPASKPMQ